MTRAGQFHKDFLNAIQATLEILPVCRSCYELGPCQNSDDMVAEDQIFKKTEQLTRGLKTIANQIDASISRKLATQETLVRFFVLRLNNWFDQSDVTK